MTTSAAMSFMDKLQALAEFADTHPPVTTSCARVGPLRRKVWAAVARAHAEPYSTDKARQRVGKMALHTVPGYTQAAIATAVHEPYPLSEARAPLQSFLSAWSAEREQMADQRWTSP